MPAFCEKENSIAEPGQTSPWQENETLFELYTINIYYVDVDDE
jgi:hypothetical protein